MPRGRTRRPLLVVVRGWLKDQAKIQVVLPVAVALGLLGYVLSVAASPHSAGEVWTVIRHAFFPVLLLTFPYLAARAYVWRQLLLQLGFKIPWPQLAAAFAAGEMTKSIPAGVYTQNYVLGKLYHFNRVSTVRSSTATTAMLGLETLVAVPVVLILGVPGESWVRLALIAVVGAWLVVLFAAWVLTHYWQTHLNPRRHPRLRSVMHLAAEFLDAGGELVARRTAWAILPTILYMLVYVVDLHFIIRALGVPGLEFSHLMVVYAVTILAVVLIPIPTEIGITEITGFSVLEAYGVPGPTAAVAMLSLRVLATGLTIILAGVVLFSLRGELRQGERGEAATGRPVSASQ